jgi:hypothetical protein
MRIEETEHDSDSLKTVVRQGALRVCAQIAVIERICHSEGASATARISRHTTTNAD